MLEILQFMLVFHFAWSYNPNMKERSPEARKFDDHTPEGVVARIGLFLNSLERDGEAAADATYSSVLLKTKDLFDAAGGLEFARFEAIAGEVIPPAYGESHMPFADWCELMRLVPMRMLNKNVPDREALTPGYIDTLMETTFSQEPRHGSDCMLVPNQEGNEYICNNAWHCPAKASRRILDHAVRDLLWFRNNEDDGGQSDPDVVNRTMAVVDAINLRFAQYGLEEEHRYRETLVAVNNRQRAFLKGMWMPDVKRK